MRTSVCNYILRWVEKNICTGNGINELVVSTGYSRKTIELWFQRTYNMSLYSYLLRRRMTFAATLLKLTNISITEIAYTLHYSSHQNFCRAFKKYTSRTPSEYRKEDFWDFSIMQWSLIYQRVKQSTYTITRIKEQYFTGDEFIVMDNLHQGGGENLCNNIKWLVESFWAKNRKDVVFLFDMKDKLSRALINVKNFNESDVYIKLKVGTLNLESSEENVIIPEGNYLIYFFSGSWEDYIIYSRPLYVRMMSEINASLKNSPVYVRFLYKENILKNKNNYVECEIYSPLS
ncbi:helix-turn-helix transcriptional regulator [Escherichia coli]|uniref:helix-turn-helix transcriptional regulator n=2 Tax=Escherichia coli TaxID=562 RepID=UPI0004508A5F|nr:helix-turn-helix transcriptional regulator [Escherichia coli]ELP2953619.1 helix-turn-helix transcriptional regulator [Escherichia coli O168]EEY3177560.1 helix-turn-helix transcriptional regulator [Escherichia coli]EEY6348996.1 helix-turn-helix transcriptional regulator [Escherichia coli]EFE0784236.1 helix-turn-helix transcriptional regulator [Escherichia coli]EFF3112767.1 helix-turn-helix transcriptional regulator [Escherichia coli]